MSGHSNVLTSKNDLSERALKAAAVEIGRLSAGLSPLPMTMEIRGDVAVAAALVEALAALESLACITKVETPPAIWCAPTGEEFDILRSGGLVREGEHAPIICRDPLAAIRFWKDAALEYAATRGGTLYWRTPPEMDEVAYDTPEFGKGAKFIWYSVYSRLLISDKPRIDAAA